MADPQKKPTFESRLDELNALIKSLEKGDLGLEDAIATFKSRSLDSMQKTVDSLSTEVTKARTYLDRVRQQQSSAALGASSDLADVKL